MNYLNYNLVKLKKKDHSILGYPTLEQSKNNPT